MKILKHIWKYLTSPTYRYWMDFCSLRENIDRNMNLIEDNLRFQSHPMFKVEDNKITKLK
jgi:hypothetical protein